MPRYDYACAACARRFEVVHGISEEGPSSCPLCGAGPVRKAFAPPAIHFKGTGWAKKERRATAAPASSASSDGGGERQPASDGAGSGSDGEGASAGGGSSPAKDASPVSGPASD
jgi:putative FmdB family regulatory protein